MKNKLIFENTYYSLFLYTLYDPNWKVQDYLLWGDRFTTEAVEHMSLHINVLSTSFSYMPRVIPKLNKDPINYFKRKIEQKNIFKKYPTCIGNVREINNWLITIKRIQIDDGSGTWNELIKGPKSRTKLDVLSQGLVLKEANKIQRTDKFILSKNINALEKFKSKIKVIDLFSLWNDKTSKEQKDILSLFDVNYQNFINITEDFCILFTQPWSESRNDYSEQDKIDGYKHYVESLGIDFNKLVIKPHPAEKTDYALHFPGALVIKASFPAELMPILGVTVDKVLTVTSTAGNCFKGHCSEILYAKGSHFFNFPADLVSWLNKVHIE